MYPYWILGILVIYAVWFSSNRYFLRITKKPIIKWIRFLAIVTLIRIILFKFLLGAHLESPGVVIPLPIAFTVFWEDACHGLPLALFKKMIGNNKWLKPLYWVLMAIVMVEFGFGHLYQGVVPAMFLTLYVPYSVKMGEKHGFGTVMIGHILYDLATMLFVKYML